MELCVTSARVSPGEIRNFSSDLKKCARNVLGSPVADAILLLVDLPQQAAQSRILSVFRRDFWPVCVARRSVALNCLVSWNAQQGAIAVAHFIETENKNWWDDPGSCTGF